MFEIRLKFILTLKKRSKEVPLIYAHIVIPRIVHSYTYFVTRKNTFCVKFVFRNIKNSKVRTMYEFLQELIENVRSVV